MGPLQTKAANHVPCLPACFPQTIALSSKYQSFSVETHDFLWQKLVAVDVFIQRDMRILSVYSGSVQTAPKPITIHCRYKAHIFSLLQIKS